MILIGVEIDFIWNHLTLQKPGGIQKKEVKTDFRGANFPSICIQCDFWSQISALAPCWSQLGIDPKLTVIDSTMEFNKNSMRYLLESKLTSYGIQSKWLSENWFSPDSRLNWILNSMWFLESNRFNMNPMWLWGQNWLKFD